MTISPHRRQQVTSLASLLLLSVQPALPVLAQPQNVESRPRLARPRRGAASTSAWSKIDHDLALLWLKNLKAFTDQLDDCTYKGRFSNLDAVPDVCNAAFFGASDVLAGRPEDGLLTLLLRRLEIVTR